MGGLLVVWANEQIGRHGVGDQKIGLDHQVGILLHFQVVQDFTDTPCETIKAFVTEHPEQYFVSRVRHHRNAICLQHRCVWPVRALTDPDLAGSEIIQTLYVGELGQRLRQHHADAKAEKATINREGDRSQKLFPLGRGGYIGDINQARLAICQFAEHAPLTQFFTANNPGVAIFRRFL